MTIEQDMAELRSRLIVLRQRMLDRELHEQDVWSEMERCEHLLESCREPEPKTQLELIYSLLAVVWQNLRELRSLRDHLAG